MGRPIEVYYPPEEFDYKPVVVFRTHERIKNGKHIKVGKAELQEIADTHNDLWEKYARASPLSLGHTLDGDVLETMQPDVAGPAVRFHVEPVPEEKDEYFLWATWCRPKAKLKELEGFNSLSPEYYPGRSLLFPISLLRSSCPELPDMPPPPTKYANDEDCYRLVIRNPFSYSLPTENSMNDEDMKDKKPADDKPKSDVDKEKDKAVEGEKKGSKQDASDISEIKAMLGQLQPLLAAMPQLMELVQMLQDEGGDGDKDGDLMQPDKDAGAKPEPKGDKPMPKEDKPVEADRSKAEPPVDFSAMGSATNCYVPGTSKKENYKMTEDEMIRYKNELKAEVKAAVEAEMAAKYKAELDVYKKTTDDIVRKNRRMEAERLVYQLETDFLIQFDTPEIKEEEIKTLSELKPEHAKVYFERAKVRYKKKTPVSVAEVAKYQQEGTPDFAAKTPEEAQERALKAVQAGLSMEQFYEKLLQGKK